MTSRLLLTCEHGGNRVPRRYAALFRGQRRTLASHRGYDGGALEVARRFAARHDAPLIHATVSRLLIDLNRSLHHRRVFSEFTASLDAAAKAAIIRDHYHPYRQSVERTLDSLLSGGGRVVHVSVHSFSPQLNGVRRSAEVGLLYDPRRPGESAFCDRWCTLLRRLTGLRVRRNYPYLGKSDGLTTALRRRHDGERYLGIELEVNRALWRPQSRAWRQFQDHLIEAFSLALEGSHNSF
jgi:predicted N-formylglutamate amidohydrolase